MSKSKIKQHYQEIEIFIDEKGTIIFPWYCKKFEVIIKNLGGKDFNFNPWCG